MKQLFVLTIMMFSVGALGSDLLYELKLQFPEKAVEVEKKDAKTSPLYNLKQNELKKKWSECANDAKKVFEKNEKVRDWVLLSWLFCTRKEFEDKKSDSAKLSLNSALAVVEKNKSFLLTGPAHTFLLQEMIKSRLSVAEASFSKLSKPMSKTEKELFVKNLDILSSYNDILDRETKARVYYYYSEVALSQHSLVGARQFLELSLQEKETSAAVEKFNSVKLALGEKNGESPDKNNDSFIQDDEKKMEVRLEQSLSKNDLINILEDGVSYLNEFPNSRKSKFVSEKILDIVNQLYEKQNRPESDKIKFGELRERAFVILERADFMRQVEWAKAFHKRGDFQAALRLTEKSFTILSHSAQGASMLWLMGRSAQFLGFYAQAQKYFEEYLRHHSAGEDANEVMFRLALVYVRQSQYSSAVATLEKLLLKKNSDRYDLSARYWLVRALQFENNPRAEKELSFLIDKYPYTYYGLRLRAEKKSNILELPEFRQPTADLSRSFYLSRERKNQIEKIELLIANGWSAEAQREILTIPTPKDAGVKILMSKKWAKGEAFPTVIKLTNEAIDLDPNLRSLDLIQQSYPAVFEDQIQKEAKKNRLSPILVRSLIRQESAFGPFMVSSSNAMGLMQMIPPTAVEIAQDLKIPKFAAEDVYEPDLNIQMGTYYIARMIKKFGGNVPLGLAAYNAGPHKLLAFIQARSEVLLMTKYFSSKTLDEIWIDELPWSETSIYVKAILRNSLMYKALSQNKVILSDVIWSDLSEISTTAELDKSPGMESSGL